MSQDERAETDTGRASFQTTRWTEIEEARTQDPDRRREILGTILARYWKPVYSYLRRKGCDHDDATDMVQGFFCEVVLNRGLVSQADRAKGRFRTFLLTALDRYSRSAWRARTARKRLPEGGVVSLDGSEALRTCLADDASTPDEAFNRAWAADLLDQVLAEVEVSCRDDGLLTHWEVFRSRLLRPIMENTDPPSLLEVCAENAVADEVTASNMIVTVKRRFQAALRRRVRELVDFEEQVDAEIRDLMASLSSHGASP